LVRFLEQVVRNTLLVRLERAVIGRLELVEVEAEQQLEVLVLEQFLENKFRSFFFEPVELEPAQVRNFGSKMRLARQKPKLGALLLRFAPAQLPLAAVQQLLFFALALFAPPRRARNALFAPLRAPLSLFLLDRAPFFRICFANPPLSPALLASRRFSDFRADSLFRNNRSRQLFCLVCRFRVRIFRRILLNNQLATRVFQLFRRNSTLSRSNLDDLFRVRIFRRILLKNQSRFDAFRFFQNTKNRPPTRLFGLFGRRICRRNRQNDLFANREEMTLLSIRARARLPENLS
jgi:hypothetical protein